MTRKKKTQTKRKTRTTSRSKSKKRSGGVTWVSLIVVAIVIIYALFTGKMPEGFEDILEPPATPRTEAIGQGNTAIESFSSSKRILLADIYYDQDTTFYCGSLFDQNKDISHKKSGYVPHDKDNSRAYRLEWEHVVPAHAFGQSFPAWRDGDPACVDSDGDPYKGRKCAERVSPEFRLMEADMYNLVPAIGEVNGLRSNYSFAMIPGEARTFGKCNMEIEDRKAEPPDNRYGDIARIYRYMDDVYPGHGIISNKNEKLFEAWINLDPVDKWECERIKRIQEIQGNENHVTKAACREAGLW